MSSKGLSGELSSLGVTQIMVGVIQVTFGIPFFFATRNSFGSNLATPFWTGIWYIISGALSTEIKDASNSFKVKIVFATNVISAFMAGLGIIAYSMSLYYPLSYYDYYHGAHRPLASLTFVMMLQLFTAAELVVAIFCAVIIGKNLFRCCNLNSVS
ncbi:membrane-spanning 4-domains subfamily A member 15-like, partial [Scyliorhinus torazame]|uniref:membrane-spanning 4-domains subfamily A member 15-like n=1 Tax=Scyliorhinus torazame TaxID=75743 RepID=UPI003B5CC8F3